MQQITRGSRVYDIADRRHEGLVTRILIGSAGHRANITWDNGLKSCLIPCADLRIVPPETEHLINEQEQMREALR